MTKVIGRFIPTGAPDHRQPFNVLTMEPSKYLAPAWQGKKENGEEYHVIEKAWKFEPVWNGEGLPPVDLLCEWRNDRDWCRAYLRAKINTEAGELLVIEPAGGYALEWRGLYAKFRPIRSEADKKRDEAVEAMVSHKDNAVPPDENYYHAIYDAIAAGKIPGVKLSD